MVLPISITYLKNKRNLLKKINLIFYVYIHLGRKLIKLAR